MTVTLEDDGLKVGAGGGAGEPMTALSETLFTGFGGRIEFGTNDAGEVTHLTYSAAEGDIRANKKK